MAPRATSEREPQPAAEDSAPRRRVACRVAQLLGALLPPAARARALAEATILGDWPLVVGPELAERCTPIALRGPAGRGATLELAVRPGAALELQHMAPLLIERINGHLGYRAVARLVLRQRSLPSRKPEAAAGPPPDPMLDRLVEADLANLADPGLKAALGALGRTLLSRRPTRHGATR